MKKSVFYLLMLTISAVILSGCTFEDIFAKLATTNEEQGAREQYERDQMLVSKQKRIDEKKGTFAQTLPLIKVNESDPFQAFVFINPGNPTTQIDLEAILPNPGREIYELWLRNPTTKEIKSLGALQYNQTDDYSLSYQGPIDLNAYSNVVLTREANPDNQPETIIMTGSLTTSTH